MLVTATKATRMAPICNCSCVVLVACLIWQSGCANCCRFPDECARAMNCCATCGFPRCLCDCGCGGHAEGAPCGCKPCPAGCRCPRCRRRHEHLIKVGPPARRFQPEMPPEFLPVPVQPVFASVNMTPLPEVRGVAEISDSSQWIFPSGE